MQNIAKYCRKVRRQKFLLEGNRMSKQGEEQMSKLGKNYEEQNEVISTCEFLSPFSPKTLSLCKFLFIKSLNTSNVNYENILKEYHEDVINNVISTQITSEHVKELMLKREQNVEILEDVNNKDQSLNYLTNHHFHNSDKSSHLDIDKVAIKVAESYAYLYGEQLNVRTLSSKIWGAKKYNLSLDDICIHNRRKTSSLTQKNAIELELMRLCHSNSFDAMAFANSLEKTTSNSIQKDVLILVYFDQDVTRKTSKYFNTIIEHLYPTFSLPNSIYAFTEAVVDFSLHLYSLPLKKKNIARTHFFQSLFSMHSFKRELVTTSNEEKKLFSLISEIFVSSDEDISVIATNLDHLLSDTSAILRFRKDRKLSLINMYLASFASSVKDQQILLQPFVNCMVQSFSIHSPLKQKCEIAYEVSRALQEMKENIFLEGKDTFIMHQNIANSANLPVCSDVQLFHKSSLYYELANFLSKRDWATLTFDVDEFSKHYVKLFPNIRFLKGLIRKHAMVAFFHIWIKRTGQNNTIEISYKKWLLKFGSTFYDCK